MGSVKELVEYEKPKSGTMGRGDFVFSDDYSIFDWGKMPDQIPYKGKSICLMAAWNFEQLKKTYGFDSHYVGLRDLERLEDSIPKIVREGPDKYVVMTSLSMLKSPTNIMNIHTSNVIKPDFKDGEYDYSYFKENRGNPDKLNNFVIPLEVIHRNGAPKGSSLFRRLNRMESEGKTDEIEEMLSKYGLKERPRPGEMFPQTGFEFTTKFEEKDRELSDDEAYEISGLTEEQFSQLKTVRQAPVNIVYSRGKEVGLDEFDGKEEYQLCGGHIGVVDVFGTFDENRFMFNGVQVSKEILRQIYKERQPEWVQQLERAKRVSEEEGIKDWRMLVEIEPKSIDPRITQLVGEMYAAGAELYTGIKWWPEVRELDEIMNELELFVSVN